MSGRRATVEAHWQLPSFENSTAVALAASKMKRHPSPTNQLTPLVVVVVALPNFCHAR